MKTPYPKILTDELDSYGKHRVLKRNQNVTDDEISISIHFILNSFPVSLY